MGYKYVYLGAWLIGCMLSACSGKKQETTVPTAGIALPNAGNDTEQVMTEAIAIEQETELNDSIVQELFMAIPTLHGLKTLQPERLERLTDELRRCLLEYAATDTIYLTGREEKWFPYEHILGEPHYDEYLSYEEVAGKDSVIINYTYYDSKRKKGSIRIQTKLENGKWKVADFPYETYRDTIKSGLEKLKTEINDRRIIFRSPEFRKGFSARYFISADKYLNDYPDSLSIAKPHRMGLVIEGDSAQVEQVWDSGLTEEIVKSLYKSISNYHYQDHPQEIFGPGLLPLVEAALAIPEDDLEGMSYKWEWLSSLTFDYECPTNPVTFYVTPFNKDSVLVETVRIAILDGGDWRLWKENHVMHLTKHDGKWLISYMKDEQDLSRYISFMRVFFRSEKWTNECLDCEKSIEQEKDSVKKAQMQEHLLDLKEQVKEYFEKYPDKP